MPNLDKRLIDWSIRDASKSRASSPAAFVSDLVPCLNGCGTLVGAGQKCAPCATAITVAWWESPERHARAAKAAARSEADTGKVKRGTKRKAT